MDGFHLYRRELDAMADPAEAHKRRGAHWTFDAAAFVACVAQIKSTGAALVRARGPGPPEQGMGGYWGPHFLLFRYFVFV